ncbi:MAG: alpha/beta fold hydrolase [Candidatus Bathyarchaeota archaeon]|nr:alpha/beta fold hydrolase [Candidatus Bathyarchaeota archaeon]
MGSAVVLDTDFGNLDVEMVSIPDRDHQLSGVLYRPIDATQENPLPAIVLVHGISGSKQMVSGIALELGRHGFVALAVDLVGHGNSEGVFRDSNVDPTLGTLASVQYLESQPYTRASIGLIGHSLGAGAIRATAAAHRNIAASVFIGGGFGSIVADPVYGTLNSTHPRNLLVAIGKYDVLFDMGQLEKELSDVFGIQEITPDRLYGNFSTQTARKLITPATTHLFEPFDLSVVSEIVLWMTNALKSESPTQDVVSRGRSTYLYREVAILVSLSAFVCLIFPISAIILNSFPSAVDQRTRKTKYGTMEDWKSLITWGLLGLILFVPMFSLGFLIPFPPLIFGSSFAWWLLSVATSGLLLILFLLPKYSAVRLDPKSLISESFNRLGATIAVVLFTMFYTIENLTETIFLTDLRFLVIPIFNDLKPTARILTFLMFVPFFLTYFFVEGLYLHEFRKLSNRGWRSRLELSAMGKAIAMKTSPYVAVLCVNYIPMLLLDFRIFPVSVGFLMEFLWGVIALFIISTACSWWFYRCTSAVGTGAIFNALLFAWSAASIFPFGGF